MTFYLQFPGQIFLRSHFWGPNMVSVSLKKSNGNDMIRCPYSESVFSQVIKKIWNSIALTHSVQVSAFSRDMFNGF